MNADNKGRFTAGGVIFLIVAFVFIFTSGWLTALPLAILGVCLIVISKNHPDPEPEDLDPQGSDPQGSDPESGAPPAQPY